MINIPFFTDFLKISNLATIIALTLLVLALLGLKGLKTAKVSFSNRMIIALVAGLVLGIGIDLGIPAIMGSTDFYKQVVNPEITNWYSLLGSGFLKLVQLLAVPVVFLSIIKVVTEVKGENLKGLTWKSFTLLLGTTAIAAIVGILVVKLFGLDSSSLSFEKALSDAKMSSIDSIAAQSFPEFFLALIPNNIIATFSDNGKIVSVVIIAALIASALRFLTVKKPEQVKPFMNFLDSLSTVITSVLTNVIKFMPYGIVALVANTIIKNGTASIVNMLSFIGALYTGVLVMMLVHTLILAFTGFNPIQYFKKGFSTLVFAFSSRSSVGTLPLTLKTLQEDFGVSGETANFVGTLGTTIGMNGCAGVFPAMLAVIVASASGLTIDIPFLALVVIVVTVGSIGIAGVPGTATVAATVTLNGIGLGSAMNQIGAIFGVDPIVDMGRTMLNVSGSMVSALVVDKWEGHIDMEKYNAPSVINAEEA